MFNRQIEIQPRKSFTYNLFPRDWLEALSALITPDEEAGYAGLPDYDTVIALLVAVTGDHVAACMMQRIFAWYKSKGGSEFFISESHWLTQCGATPNQVKRVKKHVFPKLGVTWDTKSAYRSEKVSHYRLNVWRFLQRLSEVVSITVADLTRFFSKATGRSGGKQPDVRVESNRTLTIDSTKEKTKDESEVESLPSQEVNGEAPADVSQMRKLLKAGLSRDVASRFVDLPEDIVQACIDGSNKPHVEYRLKYLETSLVNQLREYNSQPRQSKPKYDLNSMIDDVPDNDVTKFFRFGQTVAAPEANQDQLLCKVGDNYTAAKVWKLMMSQMELQATHVFRDLERCEVIGYADGEFVAWVRYEAMRTYLQHRAYRLIGRLLADISGVQDIAVRFVLPDEVMAGSDTR